MQIKGLNFEQYEAARQTALERVKSRIGQRPTREQFKRELATIWTPLDSLAMVVFMAALIISSAHIITHMGKMSAETFANDYTAGVVMSVQTYTLVHQVGMVALAESSMLLFMVLHGITRNERHARPQWSRWFSVPLLLAIIAAVFVFLANIHAELGLLESIMPPVFTVGIGLRLERLIVDLIERRKDIDRKYIHAMDVYESASSDPERHPDYVQVLRASIWEKLVNLPSNKAFKDAPGGFKAAAVRRELDRDAWAHGDVSGGEDWQPEPVPTERPTNARKGATNIGVTRPTVEDPDDTQPTQSVNALTGNE